MSKYIKYSLMFVFALCSVFLIRQQSVQADSVFPFNILNTYYGINGSTLSVSNVDVVPPAEILNEAYNEISSNNYSNLLFMIHVQSDAYYCELYYSNYAFNVVHTSRGYELHSASSAVIKVAFSKNNGVWTHDVISFTGDGSPTMSYLGNPGGKGSPSGQDSNSWYFLSTSIVQIQDSNISIPATMQFSKPDGANISWSGLYDDDYTKYTIVATTDIQYKLKYILDGSNDWIDFPNNNTLVITNNCSLQIAAFDSNDAPVSTKKVEITIDKLKSSTSADNVDISATFKTVTDSVNHACTYFVPVLTGNSYSLDMYRMVAKCSSGADNLFIVDSDWKSGVEVYNGNGSGIQYLIYSNYNCDYQIQINLYNKTTGDYIKSKYFTVHVSDRTNISGSSSTSSDTSANSFGLSDKSNISDVLNSIKDSTKTFGLFFSIVPRLCLGYGSHWS